MDHVAPPGVSRLTDFYREEFLSITNACRPSGCFSPQAIKNAEDALLKIIADLDRLSKKPMQNTSSRNS